MFQPGVGMNVDPKALDAKAMSAYAENASKLTGGGTVDFLMKLIPTTVVNAFATGDVLQVLLFAVLFGCALAMLGERGAPVANFIDTLSHVLFKIMGIIIKLAPFGVLGAIAFTVGKYGIGSLKQLGMLVVLFYGAVIIFVVVVLGAIMRFSGFSHLQAAALPARGADGRVRHHLERQRAAADHVQAQAHGHPRLAPSAWSSRPATRSTSTRSRSTSRWPPCSSPRRPTRRSR